MSPDRWRSRFSSHARYLEARQEGLPIFGENADTVREQSRLYVEQLAAQTVARRYVKSLTYRIEEDLQYAELLLGPLKYIRDTDPSFYRFLQRLADTATPSAVARSSVGSSTDLPNRRRKR